MTIPDAVSEDNALSRHIPAIDAFNAICEAKRLLIEACILTVPEAADELQELAQRFGLIDALGTDRVAWAISDAFQQLRDAA